MTHVEDFESELATLSRFVEHAKIALSNRNLPELKKLLESCAPCFAKVSGSHLNQKSMDAKFNSSRNPADLALAESSQCDKNSRMMKVYEEHDQIQDDFGTLTVQISGTEVRGVKRMFAGGDQVISRVQT